MNYTPTLPIRPEDEPINIAGTEHMTMIGHPSSVRLRVLHNTDRKTLEAHVHRFTLKETTCYTDEWIAYDHIIREHKTVCHTEHEWARDEDGDGIREVYTKTAEGMWTDVRNYLRPFKGVHKMYLSGYMAVVEFRRISNGFHLHSSPLS